MIIRGVILDMDGVLCDSEEFISHAARQMFAELHGVEVQLTDFLPFVGTGEDRFLGGVAEKHGVVLDMSAAKQRTYDLYLELIKGRLNPLNGARKFVGHCKSQGLKTALATSADRVKMEGNLREIGIPAAWFDAIVTGNDVARKKPFPDVFQRAAQLLELPCAECLVIEDAPNGLQAALAADCLRLGITSSFSEQVLRDAGAQWIAPDLANVPDEIILMSHSEGSGAT